MPTYDVYVRNVTEDRMAGAKLPKGEYTTIRTTADCKASAATKIIRRLFDGYGVVSNGLVAGSANLRFGNLTTGRNLYGRISWEVTEVEDDEPTYHQPGEYDIEAEAAKTRGKRIVKRAVKAAV